MNAPPPELAPALPITTSGSPDWSAIEQEITCPLCGYNLRGLTDPICPECGHRFEWPTVLDPSKRIHPYLFEHHPEGNVRSFVRTLLGQRAPWDFWSRIEPAQPPRVRRVVAYGVVCSIVAMLPVLIAIGAAIPHLRPPITWPGVERFLRHDMVLRGLFIGCGIAALFPWLNALALQVFGQSLRRVRIKPVHVLRCAIYSGDVVFWFGLFACMTVARFYLPAPSRRFEAMFQWLALAAAVAFVVHFARLVWAYRRYMRFDHVLAVIVCEQTIVLLVFVALIAYMVHS